MTCREAIYSNSVLDYIVNNYNPERYDPICTSIVDMDKVVIYKQEDKINSEAITRYGMGAVPHVYGLMSEAALEESGVLRIRRQPYLDLLGQGTLIGFVDTGIDFTHPAFLNADNTTRIHSIWDQTIREAPPANSTKLQPFEYGRYFSEAEINAALQDSEPLSLLPTRDDNGHGTFLAGVAAGGEIPGEDFSGVAPLSQIVVVKCKEAKSIYREFYRVPPGAPCYQENDIITGISYILRVAQELKKPVVICIGMGTSLGNHDGDCPLCTMIDYFNMIRRVCIVTCVGNEGNARHHCSIQKGYEEIGINVEKSTIGFVCQLWWRTPGSLQFDVISPAGNSLGITRASSGLYQRKNFVVENTRLEVLGGDTPQDRDQLVMFRFEDSKEGLWKIRVYSSENEVNYNMWLPIQQFLEGETFFVNPDPNITICDPGSSQRAVSVTAYNPVDNALYLQAGRGYTVSGFVKPDVAAPGVGVLGPLPKGRYGTMNGTSVAAAITAGISALFMQQYGSISGNTVREYLVRGANRRGDGYPNREWGYGTVDAYNSIAFE